MVILKVMKTEEGILHEVPLILKKLHQRIDLPYFVRTHHSFLVNINYIDKIIGNFELLELSTQEQIPVSRNKRPEVRNILGSQNSI
jgi:DNA-binding LytR/AlgR family response regulator